MHSFMIFRLPVPADDDQAWNLVNGVDDDEEELEEALAPDFLPFIKTLTDKYPESDPEESVWAEGPLESCGGGDILWVSVSSNHLEEGVQDFLIATSKASGFTAFDTDSGEIHRP